MEYALLVNGDAVQAKGDPATLLVDLLRDELGLTGTKVGCETGECGACTVLVDGKAVKSCMTLAVQAEGTAVTTIEGLAPPGQLTPIQEAFWEEFAVQDGFTTPGVVMSVTDLLHRNADPTETEIRSWLDGNLCRVTGYHNIVRAVTAAAQKLKQGDQTRPIEPAATNGNLVGESVRPTEAPGMLRGETKFIGDTIRPGMLHAAILRSPHGHAVIKGIDTSVAEQMPGVVRIYTGADVAHLAPLPVIWVPTDVESHWPPHPSGMVPGGQSLLATGKVRFAGDQVAVVVAESVQQAYAALDAVKVDYEVLPAVIDAEDAVKAGAPQLHDAVPNNLIFTASMGDKDAADAAIAEAEVVVRERIRNQRIMASTIEARGALAEYDAKTGEYTLWTNVQPLWPIRLLIALYVMGIPYNKLRVIAPAIGSSLGAKGYLFTDGPLMLWLAKEVGRPVKWLDTRSSNARSTPHGRDHTAYATLAGSRDGKISALSCQGFNNLGAYPVINAPGSPRTLIGRSVTGAYDIANPYYEVNLILTNTSPVGPIRGSGRAEAIYLIERMIDLYAREIGMDPADVRRINMVKPDQFPFENRLGWVYDSGDYPAALDRALQMSGYRNLDKARADARIRGKRLGVGIGSYVAVAGVGPSAKMGQQGLVSGTWGSAYITVEPTGEVSVTTGAQPHGQSQVTTFAQIVAQELGVPMGMVTINHSDTNGALYYGQASYGSRSLSVEGVAVYVAAQQIKEKARLHAAHLFHCAPEAVVYGDGKVFATFAPDQAVMTLQQVAFTLWLGWDLAEGMTPGLEARGYFEPPEFNYPFGTHVAIVEVDEATGKIDLVRYVAVNDFGNVINPGVVDAQSHGNIALGAGQALFEEVVYDEASGALLTDSYSTYPIVKASELPSFDLARTVTPTPNNPLGAKGVGDVSNPPVAPAIVNAVLDALADLGIRNLDMPLKPDKVWRAIAEAKAGRPAGVEARRRCSTPDRIPGPRLMPISFDYAAPSSISDAVSRMGTSRDARVLAGGQGLMTEVKAGSATPRLVVDLRNVPDLAGIGPSADGHFRSGAMVTIDALAACEQVSGRESALADCVLVFGDPQVRNRATVGGALANAQSGVDLPAVALALGATVHTVSPEGARSVEPATSLEPAEIVTAVDWPVAAPGTASAYEKVRDPGSGYALCGAAVSITVAGDGTVEACRIALSGTTRPAVRLPKVEAALIGRPATDGSLSSAAGQVADEGIDFPDDVAAPADYRAHLAEVLVARALARATDRARMVTR